MTKVNNIEDIRNKLSSIQIPKDKIETKGSGNFTAKYISWSYALGVILKHYPEFKYEFTIWEQADGTMVDVQYYKDGSCSVEVNCSIGDVKQHMWLPVTKSTGNQPSTNCFDINTAKMRCLTKCISVGFGLGSDIYGMDMLQEFKTEKVEGISNESPKPSRANPLPKGSPSPELSTTEEEDFDFSQEILCGYNKGKDYTSYDNDIAKVRKDMKFWKSNAKNDDQVKHFGNLKKLETILVDQATKNFKNRVA
jgi:hypothetical protein